MASRRQEKFAKVIKKAVSRAILEGLSDPRIEGFISVTRVEMSPDLRNAYVFLSIFGSEEKAQKKTFAAIRHGRSKIQSVVAGALSSKFCPVLHFEMDEVFKKTLETMRIINEAAKEFHDEDQEQLPDNEL